MFYVYLHRRATDGKVFYVGKGKLRRAFEQYHRTTYWKRVVAKYGYTIEFVEKHLQEWYALELECNLIAYYGRENLCNHTDGGDGTVGYKHTEYDKNRMNAAKKGTTLNKDHLAKLSISLKAAHARPEVKAKHLAAMRSEEVRKKLSIAGKNMSQAQKDGIARLATGRKPSKEARLKMSLSRLGELNYAAVTVKCVETGNVFKTITNAVQWLRSIGFYGASTTSISRACNGKRRASYGYTWERIEK